MLESGGSIDAEEGRRLLQEAVALVRDRDALRAALQATDRPPNMIGNSMPILEVFRLVEKVKRLDCSVLIQGESGTGKEIVARALHNGGPRKDGRFVCFTCGGFTEELISHFLKKYSAAFAKEVGGITPEAKALLARFPFPGNVRELENIIERAVALTDHTQVTIEDLPPEVLEVCGPDANGTAWPTLEEHERRYIASVLEHTGRSRSEAAAILDLPRTTLWRKMKRFGLG